MNRPYFVGVAGGSAGGKSTFCDQLCQELKDLRVIAIHMDDYFKPEEARPYAKSPMNQNMYIDDNHPETIDLGQIKLDISKALSEDCDIVIVEGLLTLWDEDIYQQLDLKLFVDCRADERIVRRLRRNMGWGLSFDQIANVYLDMVRYRHDEYVEPTKWKADLILNGSQTSPIAITAIAGTIRQAVHS